MKEHRHWRAQGEKKVAQGSPKGSPMEAKMEPKSLKMEVLEKPIPPRGHQGAQEVTLGGFLVDC